MFGENVPVALAVRAGEVNKKNLPGFVLPAHHEQPDTCLVGSHHTHTRMEHTPSNYANVTAHHHIHHTPVHLVLCLFGEGELG